ncbi:hypothetical protein K2173_002612 [Erythroxylum novogranatense]|uniref:Transferase n=1 Tax=Erythroxylum novogranatense TaxID=1862640 RepID=A0AAV8SWZ4_9ROSI|nr:hypothetical protein K2173_002612 [Erythroxylum novogranatense]
MKVETEVISRDMVMPSSPTPDHRRKYQLSCLDQISRADYMPWVLLYPKTSDFSNLERCNLVKKSLSEALTMFYPLAGRVVENTYVDCNDEGVLFVEVQAKCTLSDILRKPDPHDFNKFLPVELDDVQNLAVFQVTCFECGGLAISFCLSHKVGDALSFFMFLNSWAKITRGDDKVPVPRFDSAEILPPTELPIPRNENDTEKLVTRRFVFDSSTITALKERFADNRNVDNPIRPTRVEALSAFVWSRFMAVMQVNASPGKFYIVPVIHLVNLRSRADPRISEQCFGNFGGCAVAIPNFQAEDGNFGILTQIRESVKNVDSEYVKKLQQRDVPFAFLQEKAKEMPSNVESITFIMSSLCRFPINEADFGWGRPVWSGSARTTTKNTVTFIDAKDGGGVEAWITMAEEDMAALEMDRELLALATPNPECEAISTL